MGVVLVLIYGVTLLVVVLVSGLAARSVLSTSLVFLLAGAVAGDGGFGWLTLTPDSPLVSTLADLALRCCSPTGSGPVSRSCGGPGDCRDGPCCWECR